MLRFVGTPIGNLDDLSYRQAQTIASSDIILSEDTRKFNVLAQRIKKLFNLDLNPRQKLISYYKEVEFEKLPEIVKLMEEGKEISVISEAGMPVLSDPGLLLAKEAVKRNIKFEVIPGPSAFTTAMVYAGFDPGKFIYIGYLPKKENEIIKLLDRYKDIPVVFYESPARINKTMSIIDQKWPEREVVIGRELTKKFEEILRGKSSDFVNHRFKGELTIVLN